MVKRQLLKFFSGCTGLIIFLLSIVPDARAQEPDSLLNKLDKEYPQEKIYIHYDRPYYNPGETIWFKAYVFSANLPSLFSKTLYAELIDDKGNVIQRKTVPILGASAASDFTLPDSMRYSVVYTLDAELRFVIPVSQIYPYYQQPGCGG
jgi:hypothetical protein